MEGTRLRLGWLGAIGRAGALTLATVLAGMLGIAAALALAIVLALAGMFGGVGGLVLSDQEHAGIGRSGSCSRATLLSGLCVEARGSSAKKTGERRRKNEVVCSVAFHQEHLSWLGHAFS